MWASKIVVNLTQLNYDCATENTHEMRENTVALPGFMIGQEKQLAGNQVGIQELWWTWLSLLNYDCDTENTYENTYEKVPTKTLWRSHGI